MARVSFALFRDANFRALWIGQLISIFGDRFTYLALLAVVVARARHPENPAAELAVLPLASFLPAILFGPGIGALVDRADARRVLIVSDLARGLFVLAMIPATLLGGLPALFVLVFALYVANTFFLPARSAIVPLLVPRDRLTEANSLATFAGVAATIAGALAGGALVDRFGWRWGFAIDASTYFLSVIALTQIRRPVAAEVRGSGGENAEGDSVAGASGEDRGPGRCSPPDPHARAMTGTWARYRALLSEIREGFSILLRTPQAWGATGAVMLLWMAGGVLHVTVPILVGHQGHVASGVGSLLAAAACGMVLGTLLLALCGSRGSARRRAAVALIGVGASLALFIAAPAGIPAAGAAFVSGLFVVLLIVTTETAIQEAVSAEARGRVFALRDTAARFAVLVTAGTAGFAVSRGFAPRTAVLVVGALAAAAGIAGLLANGRGIGGESGRKAAAGDRS